MQLSRMLALGLVALMLLVVGAGCTRTETSDRLEKGTTAQSGQGTTPDTAERSAAEPSEQTAEETSGQAAGGKEAAEDTRVRDQLASAPFDATFIDMMVEHHTAALGMAEEAQKGAESEEVRQMAGKMTEEQRAEIDQMKEWREKWYPDVDKLSSEDLQEHMIHMMGSQDHDMAHSMMQGEIPEGEGSLDQRFLQHMIPHHQQAITMSREALEKAEHPELKQLAEKIIADQEKEIADMERLQEQGAATR